MTQITATQVNSLRQRTGISMMECKKALMEAQGDEEKAIEVLRKRGAAKAEKKANRETTEGVIVTKIEGNKAVITSLYCETDFVSKNEAFLALAHQAAALALENGAEAAKAEVEPFLKELITQLGENMSIEMELIEGQGLGEYVHTNGKMGSIVDLATTDPEKARDIAMHITAMNPAVIDPKELPEESVLKEREIWAEQLKNEGKPEEMIEKIMMGKEKKFREEQALIKQSFVKDPSSTIEGYLSGNTVKAFVRKEI